jgi:predicted enzyme related to lactoylglutathione lyase
MAFKTQLIAVSYPVSDPDAAQDFYGTLMGVELARSLTEQLQSWHSQAAAGVQFVMNPQQNPDERPMAHFAVGNLDAAVNELQQHGGNKVADFDMPVTGRAKGLVEREFRKRGVREPITDRMGRGAIVADTDGNMVALIQLEPFGRAPFRKGELTTQDLHEHEDVVKAGKELERGR